MNFSLTVITDSMECIWNRIQTRAMQMLLLYLWSHCSSHSKIIIGILDTLKSCNIISNWLGHTIVGLDLDVNFQQSSIEYWYFDASDRDRLLMFYNIESASWPWDVHRQHQIAFQTFNNNFPYLPTKRLEWLFDSPKGTNFPAAFRVRCLRRSSEINFSWLRALYQVSPIELYQAVCILNLLFHTFPGYTTVPNN